MKKFILTLIIFIFITFLGSICILLLPPTPSSSNSLIFGSVQKDSLIATTPERRIIFIGGSNLSFGLDSQMIKDSLNLNPVNMGIHAGIGLKHMLEEALPHIKSTDIVVIVPEYHQFFGDQVYGREELIQMALDVDKNILKDFNVNQWIMGIRSVPLFIGEKIYYRSYKDDTSDDKKILYYTKDSFNKYGDADKHWNITDYIKAAPMPEIKDEYNPNTMKYINSFISNIPNGTTVYISFPGFQDQSFENSEKPISKIYNILTDSKIKLLGNPVRYKFDNLYIFDTPYHLVKEGVKLRTKLLIEDLKENIPTIDTTNNK